MNTIVTEKTGYSLVEAIERAKTRSAYHEEGLRLETAAQIINAMETHGVSRSELARRLKVSPAYITKILRGCANLGLETLAKIAFALETRWQNVLIPKNANIIHVGVADEFGSRAVRTLETTTLEMARTVPTTSDYEDIKETRYDMRIPA